LGEILFTGKPTTFNIVNYVSRRGDVKTCSPERGKPYVKGSKKSEGCFAGNRR